MSSNPMAPHIRNLLLAITVASGALLLTAMLLVRPVSAEEASPMVVKIHADWCGTCTRMQPAWEQAEQALGSEARFVVLDVSDASRLQASREQAEALGIVVFFDANRSKTGTVGVLSDSGEVAASFKGSLQLDEVRAAIEKAGA